MVALLLAALGFAYETDQLTDRQLPLSDARTAANQHLDELLAKAVADTNRRTKCQADDRRTHAVLARKIASETARPAWVLKRGLSRAPGFTTYSAWLERTDTVERRAFEKRDDVFGDITVWQSVILTMAGPSSTIAIGDDLVGTDKMDHFLNFGFVAWKRSRHGRKPGRVDRFSVRSERAFFGMITSKTYSYGDIAANLDGYVFYSELLGPDSAFQRDDEGCVVQLRPFDWEPWVDWRYDEVLNPPLFTQLVQRRVTQKLERERDRYCLAWEALGAEEYDAHVREVIATDDGPLPHRFDARYDPWKLADLCNDSPSAQGGSPSR